MSPANTIFTSRSIILTLLCLTPAVSAIAKDETFIKIHKISGNRILVTKEGEGGAGGGGGGRGRGRFAGRGGANSQQHVLTIPSTAKITSAMRERRTFDFRAGAEIPGGLRHRMFQDLEEPLSARVVTEGTRILELNVITPNTDINQSNVDAQGNTVIAIRPKRPPMKRK